MSEEGTGEMAQMDIGDSVKRLRDGAVVKAGEVGTIERLYDTEPPAYDVAFQRPDGKVHVYVLQDHQIEKVDQAA